MKQITLKRALGGTQDDVASVYALMASVSLSPEITRPISTVSPPGSQNYWVAQSSGRL